MRPGPYTMQETSSLSAAYSDTKGKYSCRDDKAHVYGQATFVQVPEPFWKKQLSVPLNPTDVSPGGAAVPMTGSGMMKEEAFSQKRMLACTCERRGKVAKVRAVFLAMYR